MREIKFRGIPTYGKDFVYGSLIININEAGRKEYLIKKHIGIIEVIPETVGQYTGLKDKNGVEIYEGDIIKAIWSKDCEEYIANEIWIGDIFFNCGSFDINSEWCVALNCFNGALEVIGNIYENKELLNENR